MEENVFALGVDKGGVFRCIFLVGRLETEACLSFAGDWSGLAATSR